MQTNIQLMISMHLMDQGSTINYEVEERQLNLGHTLVMQELLKFHEDLIKVEQERIKEDLFGNYKDF